MQYLFQINNGHTYLQVCRYLDSSRSFVKARLMIRCTRTNINQNGIKTIRGVPSWLSITDSFFNNFLNFATIVFTGGWITNKFKIIIFKKLYASKVCQLVVYWCDKHVSGHKNDKSCARSSCLSRFQYNYFNKFYKCFYLP